MKLRLSFLLLCACCVSGLSFAADRFDPATMLDASQLHRGDAATSKTVFAGIAVTEFHLEILDVLHQANLGEDMILARITDGPVVARQSGVIGGMSGSPVYVGGKLIGAIAWGWPFSKEPVTGITPIRAMLQALDVMESRSAGVGAREHRWLARAPIRVGGQTFTAAQVVAPGQRVAADVLPLRPVMTPVNCSGFGPRTLKFIGDKLGPQGIQALAGGGTKADAVPVDLQPGAAVGIRFMEGDFDMTGIGTVTYRQGDQVLAFGHPLMQLGFVKMPLTTAWINEFVANYERTDKLGSGMANVGTLQADTAWAVGGQVGPPAPLIPATFEIIDHTRHLTRTFNVRVFDQPSLTPTVLTIGISQALEASYNPGAEGMIRTHFEVTGKNGATIKRDNQSYMANDPSKVGIGEVAGFMQLLEDNRWDPQEIAKLTFRAELTNRDETAAIEKAYVEENLARAGKPIRVHVLVRPDGAPLQDHVFTLNMPIDLPKGVLRLAICGGEDAMAMRSRFGIMLPAFESLPEILDFAQKMETAQQLCVIAALPSSGVSVGNVRLMHVPASIQAVFEKSTRTDMDDGKEELFASKEMPDVLFGRQMLALATEDRQGARGTVSSSATKPAAAGKSGASAVEPDELATGLWWAERALKPSVARRLRDEAAAAGTPWPSANTTPTPAKPADDTATAAAKDGKAKEPADEADTEKTDDTDAKAKTIVRQPTVWLQDEATDFSKGEATGMALPSDGGLAGAPKLTHMGRLPEGYLWGALTAGDTTYLATGAPGRIYRLGPDGKPALLCDPHVFAVRALAMDAHGVLFAGAWPGGKVLKITPDGKATVFAELPCDYVWALAFDPAGRLIAGTGHSGQLFALDANGKAEELARVPQAHILSMLLRGDAVYMGTGGNGVVYRFQADRPLQALVSADKDDFTALAAAADGPVYAGSSGGTVYRIAEGASPSVTVYFAQKDNPIYALLLRDDRLYAATGAEGKLLAITGPDRYETLYDTDPTHLLCLAPTPGGFVIGSANAAEVMGTDCAASTEGSYTSSVFDAKRQARWGLIDWQATVPEGGELQVQTRSGQSPDPDDGTWSAWSRPYDQPGQQIMNSPSARYLQYRVQMKTAQQPPLLRWLSLAYLPANQQPTVEFDDELTVEKPWKGEVEVKWTAKDPDSDALLPTLQYRKVGETAWQAVKALGSDDKSYKWKTADLKDGRYDVRLIVTDEPANPGAGLTGEQVLYGVIVDNTAPKLERLAPEAKGETLTLEGLATDNDRLTELAYQLDKQWLGLVPTDGFCDGQAEQFTLTVPLKDGKAKVTVRCRDAAGNVTTQEVVWPIPPKPETKPEAKPAPKGTEKPDGG